jgi:Fe-S-cluster formation regulator IscX/YfhJ
MQSQDLLCDEDFNEIERVIVTAHHGNVIGDMLKRLEIIEIICRNIRQSYGLHSLGPQLNRPQLKQWLFSLADFCIDFRRNHDEILEAIMRN